MELTVYEDEFMSNVSFFKLEAIKREAKKLQSQFPDLTHRQRLDIASKNILKVRNYYEAGKLVNQHVNSFLNRDNSGFAECSYCHLYFSTEEKEDVEAHKKRHLEYEKVENALGFLPMPYHKREKEKKKAYKELGVENPFATKKDGALRLIRAHFDRSLESAIGGGYWREHPTFEEYLNMLDEYAHIVPMEVMNEIRGNDKKIVGEIDRGKSYWFPSSP